MSAPGTLETLFVLSLAVERLAAVFQRRDWQPLRPRRKRPGARARHSAPIQVDLRRGEAYLTHQPGVPVALDDLAVERLLRAAHAENTLFAGGLLALLTGTNAFLGSFGWPAPSELHLTFVVQVLLTGMASAGGAALWGALLHLLEARRAHVSGGVPPPEGLAPLLPGRPLTPLAVHEVHAPGRLEQLRAAAQPRLMELQVLPGVKAVRLVDAPRRWPTHPCLEFLVELEPGATGVLPKELRVSLEGTEHAIPVRT